MARQHPDRIDVLHRTRLRGFGRSYIDGIKQALAAPVDLIGQMDADLSLDPAQLPSLQLLAARLDMPTNSVYTSSQLKD